LRYLRNLESEFITGRINRLPKQEGLVRQAELEKLQRTLGGLKQLSQRPAAIVVVDPRREDLAVKEANRLNIPVVAITDTNCDPDVIDYVIPANDDAIRAVRLIVSRLSDAIIEGSTRAEVALAEREMDMVAADFEDSDDDVSENGDSGNGGNSPSPSRRR
jgi:small subunit ribosomal protein S2